MRKRTNIIDFIIFFNSLMNHRDKKNTLSFTNSVPLLFQNFEQHMNSAYFMHPFDAPDLSLSEIRGS